MRHGSVPGRFSPSRIRTVSIRQNSQARGTAFASSGRPFFCHFLTSIVPILTSIVPILTSIVLFPDKYCDHPDKYCAFPKGRSAERSLEDCVESTRDNASNMQTLRRICRHISFLSAPPVGSPPDTPRLRMVELPYDISQ